MNKNIFPAIIATIVITFGSLAVHPTTATAMVKRVPIYQKIEGTFLTNIAGTSITQRPYIQVIRSRAGLEYLLSQFDSSKNRITAQRLRRLRKQLKDVDIGEGKKMIIGVFSKPMDNYHITLERVVAEIPDQNNLGGEPPVFVEVTYLHKIKNPPIPPKKSIYYLLLVADDSKSPVILRTTELVERKAKGKKTARVITVTGRLMPLKGEELQLVPVVIRRGNKNSYYIRNQQALDLYKHTGKVVTLQGTVSLEMNSPYEFEFDVQKLVKVAP